MFYDSKIRESVVKKVLSPGGPSVPRISKEMGIHPNTVYRWIQLSDNPDVKRKTSRRKKLDLLEKFKNLLESKEKTDEELGAFLREKGIHSEHLELWEEEIQKILISELDRSKEKSLVKENERLRKELARKEKALAEMSALVMLKKKYLELLEEEEEK
jgi:transposase-like protein